MGSRYGPKNHTSVSRRTDCVSHLKQLCDRQEVAVAPVALRSPSSQSAPIGGFVTHCTPPRRVACTVSRFPKVVVTFCTVLGEVLTPAIVVLAVSNGTDVGVTSGRPPWSRPSGSRSTSSFSRDPRSRRTNSCQSPPVVALHELGSRHETARGKISCGGCPPRSRRSPDQGRSRRAARSRATDDHRGAPGRRPRAPPSARRRR